LIKREEEEKEKEKRIITLITVHYSQNQFLLKKTTRLIH